MVKKTDPKSQERVKKISKQQAAILSKRKSSGSANTLKKRYSFRSRNHTRLSIHSPSNHDEFFEQLSADADTHTDDSSQPNSPMDVNSMELSNENRTTDEEIVNLSQVFSRNSSRTSFEAQSNASHSRSTRASSISFEEQMMSSMREILIRLSEIEKTQAKIEVRMAAIESGLCVSRQNNLQVQKLDGLDSMALLNSGLPAQSVMQLGQLDFNLTKPEFVENIVS